MAGAVDLFSGSNSISGSNLFYVDKNPLDQLTSTLSDIGQRDVFGTLADFIKTLVDGVVGFFETLTGLDLNHGPLVFFASLWEKLNNVTGLVWDDGPISFLVSIVDAIVNAIEALTHLNINEGPEAFFASLGKLLEDNTNLDWTHGPIEFLVSVVDAVVNAIETLTNLNINEGPGPFFASLWAALEDATSLVWSEGPIPFLVSVVDAVVSAIENLTQLNIDQGPGPFIESLVARIETLTGLDLSNGPASFVQSAVTATIAAIELATGLNINEGPEKFFESLLANLESITNLDWSHGPGPFLQSLFDAVIGQIEYLTGLNINAGPEPFLQSLFGELIAGPQAILGNLIQALDATGQGLAERIGRAIIAVIRGIPFVGDAIADTLSSLLDGLVWFIRGGNQSGSNLLADPGAETAAYWTATYQQGDLTVANTLWGTKKQPEVTRDTTIKRSAGASLRLTSGGTNPQSFYWNINDLGTVVPISTTVGDWFYAECYVLAPNTNVGSAAVTLVAEFSNSIDPNAKTTSSVTQGISKNDWNKVAGTFTVPFGYDRISFGFLLGAGNTTTNDKFYVDDMLVREVTGTQNTLQNIHQAIRGGDGTTLISLSAVGTALGGLTDLTRGKGEAGSNLLVDPKASYPSLWIGTGLSVSKAIGTYKSASSSLAFTSAGSTARSFDWTINDTGATTPIVAQPGDIFYCECYVLSPSGNGPATITLHGKAKNSSTGAVVTLTPQLTGSPVASGPWTKISGQYTIPSSGGYDGFIAGITLGSAATTSGDKFYIDDMLVREVTGTQTTIDAIGQAVNVNAPSSGNNIVTVKDAVASAFDLSRGTTQSGSNLLADPKISYPKWWNGQAGTVASSLYSRSTANSLQITSINPTARYVDFTVNDLGTVTPLVTKPGNVYYCEAWVYSPVGNQNCLLNMHGAVYNLASGLRGAIAAQSGSNEYVVYPAQGTWYQIYAYFKIPDTFTPDSGGTAKVPDGFVTGITLLSGWTTAGNKFYIDDLTVQDVTEAYKTNIKLYNAPQPAATVLVNAVPTGIPQANIAPSLAGSTSLATDISTTSGNATNTINNVVRGITGVSGSYSTADILTNFQNLNQSLFRSNSYPGTTGNIHVDAVPSSIPQGRILGKDGTGLLSTDTGNVYSHIDGMTLGLEGTSGSNFTVARAQAAAEKVRNAVADANKLVASIQSALSASGTPGNSASVDFTAYANSTAVNAGSGSGLWTQVYPASFFGASSGSATYGITNGRVVWSGGSYDSNRASIVQYYKGTVYDMQRVGITLSSSFGGVGSGYVMLFGRMSSDSATYVVLSISPTSLRLGYQGGQSAFGTASYTVKSGYTYWLEVGTSNTSGLRTFNVYEGNTRIWGPISDSGAYSSSGASYRGVGFGATNNYLTVVPAIASFSYYDTTPPPKKGSAFRASKSTTASNNITLTATTNFGLGTSTGTTLPSAFFDGGIATNDYITTDMTYTSASNRLTVTKEGWYSVTINLKGSGNAMNPGGRCNLILFKNGTSNANIVARGWQLNCPVGNQQPSMNMQCMIYLLNGDYIIPGYESNWTSGNVSFDASSDGTTTYFMVNFVNNTVPS